MQQRDSSHLLNQITTRAQGVPSYALLLGAGASVSSGVKTAEEMIADWRLDLYRRAQTHQSFQAWLEDQPWHGRIDEYGRLFEVMHDLPSQRRMVVEDILKSAQPSWGYVYLANLLEHGYFNVVLTTNFDDLLTEACYRYTDSTRPLVAAHDSAIRNLRVTSARPKIIKLHGDFLYDDIKNTPSETKVLEDNIKDKLRQFANEYGLVIIGYGGRDASVMNALEELLSSEDTFPNGIYWCTYGSTEQISPALQRICEDKRVYTIPIDGFDAVLADLHNATQIGLPTGLAAPFKFTRDRASILLDAEPSVLAHPTVEKDAGFVRGALSEIPSKITDILPPEILAEVAESNGNKQQALEWWKQAYDADKTNAVAAHRAMQILVDLGQTEELRKIVSVAPLGNNATYWHLLADNNSEVVRIANNELETNPYDWLSRINKAIALKRLNREKDKEVELIQLDQQLMDGRVSKGYGPFALRAGIAALRGNRRQTLDLLQEAIRAREITRDDAWRFPVFEDYRNDAAFQALVAPTAGRDVTQLRMTEGPARLSPTDSDTEDC